MPVGRSEQIAQPSVGTHRGDLQGRVVHVSGRQRQNLGQIDLPTGITLEELQSAQQLFGVDRHPLAAQPDQRRGQGPVDGDAVTGAPADGERRMADRQPHVRAVECGQVCP